MQSGNSKAGFYSEILGALRVTNEQAENHKSRKQGRLITKHTHTHTKCGGNKIKLLQKTKMLQKEGISYEGKKQ